MKLNERIEEINYKIKFLESLNDGHDVKIQLKEIQQLVNNIENILDTIDIEQL